MMPLTTLRINLFASIDRCRIDEKSMAKIAMSVSAQAYGAYGNGGCDADPHPLQQQVENVRYLVESHERRF